MIPGAADFLTRFLKLESAAGISLFLAAALAIVVANSPLYPLYEAFFATPVEIRVGGLGIDKPLLLWINDGLMAVFFFLVGLELKRELLEGELRDIQMVILPAVGAIGGMLVPAIVYLYFNMGDDFTQRGWAIPAATDIAFALGVLTLLGSRVPIALKVFLTSLAIFDDIGAILIIALFYTSEISLSALTVVAICIPVLFLLNRRNVITRSPYIFVGAIMWVAMLKSGIHATIAGVLLAMFIPMRSKDKEDESPLKNIESDLHSVVAFFILPVFAFSNAGLNLAGVGVEQVFHSVSVGVALGLFLGKQIGVFGFCWLFIKMKLTDLPSGVSWMSLYGTAALCGIGFTMSLFIGSLAFDPNTCAYCSGQAFDERLGIIIGSLASGIVGYLILRSSLKAQA